MRSLLLLASLLLACPASAGALADAQSAVLADPQDAGAWVALGDALRARLKGRAAREAYGRALAIDPESLEARAGLSALGHSPVTRLERKARRHPTDDEVWGDLGDGYLESGRTADALAAWQYALQLDPGDSEWQRKLLENGGEAALLAHGEAVLASGSDESIGDYGDLLEAAGRHDEACAAWAEASRLDPGDGEWPEKLRACGVDGGLGGPVDAVAGVGLAASSDADVLLAVAKAMRWMGRSEASLDFARRALDLDPLHAEARAAVLSLGGGTLVDLLEALVLRHPDLDELWGDLGDAYVGVGRPADAGNAYRRALALDADDAEWRDKLAWIDPSAALPDPDTEILRRVLQGDVE